MSPEVNLPAGPHLAGSEAASASSETSFLFTERKYCAFISYSHADTKWAQWLVRRLENYRVPERLHGRKAPIGRVGARIAPVFRDRDELPTTSDLGETIRSALRQSSTLIVICSPTSAKSRWVQEEIISFKRLGGSARVFAFIVDGEPKAAGTARDCFSPALRLEVGMDGELSGRPAEVVAADARSQGDGKEDAFVRLVAGLLGVGFDELRQREQARRVRRLTMIATGSVVGMAITLGLAAYAWQARNDAQRRQAQAEDVLTFMLGDFRAELKKLSRLDLLDAVGDKSIEYFNSLNPRDLTDTALMRQAKALTQIGDNRVEEARYPDAVRAYTAAYDRAAALAARHPQNGDMLFERAQAEFGIGFVHRKAGDHATALTWWTRYNATAAELVAMEPGKLKWRAEQASGLHNLAVLRLDRGELDAARKDFTAKLAALQAMLALDPADLELPYRVTDTESWLGSIAERQGDFHEAMNRFTNQAAGLAAISQREPKTMRWRFERANALSLRAAILSVTGRRDEARTALAEARQLMIELLAHDPANKEWVISACRMQLREASLHMAAGNLAETARSIATVREELEKVITAAPTNRNARVQLTIALRIEAELAVDPAAAARTITRAIEAGESAVRSGTPSDSAVAECAQADLVAAKLAAAQGDDTTAQMHARHALEILPPRWENSSDWRLLDPAVRALSLLGRKPESDAIAARLAKLGYQPLAPWPGPDSTSVRSPPTKKNNP